MKSRKIFILFLMGFWFVLLFAAFIKADLKSFNEEKITEAFDEYIIFTHPQKIYLHLDKNNYFARERINFCSYLLDGTTYKPDTADGHIYVELINPFGNLSQILRIKQTNGTGAGGFYLADSVPEGIYQVRAYTNRMKNYDPSFYFIKNISVKNSNNRFNIIPRQAKKNKSMLSKLDKEREQYELGFFPEGGQLLTNRTCRVAFKISNKFGESVDAKGEILTNNHEKVTSFAVEHNGMGSFYITPKQGESYYAKIHIEGIGSEKYFLPIAQQNTVTLSLTSLTGNISVRILYNKMVTADRPANEFILLAEAHGKICFSKTINLIDNDTIVNISKRLLPPGIIHFTLINYRLQPISERLVFIPPQINYGFNLNPVSKQDSMNILISCNPTIQSNSKYSASLSVVMVNDDFKKPPGNILSEIFLTSDLPGLIEDPEYYLQSTKETDKDVDLLMLTHGWTRYYWSDILEEKFPDQEFESEKGITLKGKITREVIEVPYPDARVKLAVMDQYNDLYATYSDKKGEFRFDDLNYNDTMDVKITARKPQGSKFLLIKVDDKETDKVVDYGGDFFLTTHSDVNMREYRRMMNQLAREKMKEREKELDSIFSESIYGRPDFVIWSDQIPPGSSNLLEVIQGRVPGVMVTGDRIIIRGINTILMSTDPLVLVDGVPTNIDILKTIPPVQVDRIEILKGASTSMYGSRGGNGVIAVYTKKGKTMIHGEISFSMLGYHVLQKFKPPSEEIIEYRKKANQYPVTIFWSPKLTIEPKQSIDASFYVPDKNSALFIVIEGIDQEGHPAVSYSRIN